MEQTLNTIKALADGNRLRAVMALTVYDELCVCQVTEILGLATATVSRHMSVLQKARLLESRKEGRWVYYRLSKGFPETLLAWLKAALAHSSEIIKDQENLKGILSRGLDSCAKRKKKGVSAGPGEREKREKYMD